MLRWLRGRKQRQRLLVLGLDCAGPQLVFEQFRDDLPNLSRLMAAGTWGTLESCVPCITVPAWSSMLSGRDPGVLGVYGFRNRPSHDYGPLAVVNGAAVGQPRVWDYLSAAGRESLVLAVPQTYPPRPLRGHLVSGFLTPGPAAAFTYPAIFREEVLRVAPGYAFDVADFRTRDRADLLQSLLDLRQQQFTLLLHALRSKSWDFAIHVDIALDRFHHAFWRYHDPTHRLHQPDSPYRHAIRDYYRLLDSQIGQLIDAAGDDTRVLVVSDHGVKRMDGGICINEWLWREGWLALKSPPPARRLTPLSALDVDWARTRAWGEGGYYGRVFLNVAGREAQGVIPPDAVPAVRDELAAAICAIPGPQGEPLCHRVIFPEQVYTQTNGIPPDLMIYFGDLHWRSVGTLGHGAHFTLENDTGPDDANHDTHGLFILYEPHQRGLGRVDGHQLMDIAPTVLHRLGVPVPAAMQGRNIET